MRSALVFLFLFAPTGVFALSPDVFLAASRRTAVPVELLLAVSHVESGFRPYALNVGGRSVFPSSRAEALVVLKRSGDNVDIGLMQVNWALWGEKLGVARRDLLLDPFLNVFLGATILSRYARLAGGWWRGVGRYHSPSLERQREYILKVWRSYRRIHAHF